MKAQFSISGNFKSTSTSKAGAVHETTGSLSISGETEMTEQEYTAMLNKQGEMAMAFGAMFVEAMEAMNGPSFVVAVAPDEKPAPEYEEA